MSRSPAPAGETLGFEARLARGAFRLDVAFEVRPGERLALVGPSGAGKSTCLQIIAGFVRPEAGHVTLGGRALLDTARGVDLPPAARDIGLLFQDYALFPHLSVRDNVAFGPRARGRSAGDSTRVAGEWLERLEIAELGAARIDRISGGQRQRVALARAMAAGARVLLLDEPFAALDLVTRSGVRAGLRAFLEQVPLPTVFVTHDPLDARVFGDRIGVLEEGRLVQLGTWQDIAHAPRSALAAELAGLNLHRVRLEAGEGLRAARVDTVEFHVLAPGLEGDVHLAFAPGEVTLSAGRPAGSAQNVFTARVVELIPVADRLRVRLDAGVPITAEITIEARAALGIEAGREIFAAVKATAIRVYR